MRTILHLVVWNRPKMTELVIETIHRNTDRDDFLLVVLDNGSEEETKELLRRLFERKRIDSLLRFEENRGLEAARQYMLVHQTPGRYFVDIDNDCLPPKNWLPRQLDLMDKYENCAAISQRTQVMIGTGNIFEDADKNMEDLVDFPHPGGSFRLMFAPAIREVGGWDRDMPGRGSEERYICGKLRDAGYKTAFAVEIQCLHLFGMKDITDRWGYPADFLPEDTGHSDISHPALTNGDDPEEIEKYSGKELTNAYCSS